MPAGARFPSAVVALAALTAGFALAGVVARIVVREAAAEHARVASLPLSSAVELRELSPGATVLVEARISHRNPATFRGFVCHVKHRYQPGQSGSRAGDWREEARVTPELWLDTRTGEVRVGNSDYRLDAAEAARVYELAEQGPAHWQDTETATYDTARDLATRRYTGFEAGQPAMVLGTLDDPKGAPRLSAQWLFGGSRDEYLRDKTATDRVLRWLPPGFWAIGALFAAALFLRLRRGLASP